MKKTMEQKEDIKYWYRLCMQNQRRRNRSPRTTHGIKRKQLTKEKV